MSDRELPQVPPARGRDTGPGTPVTVAVSDTALARAAASAVRREPGVQDLQPGLVRSLTDRVRGLVQGTGPAGGVSITRDGQVVVVELRLSLLPTPEALEVVERLQSAVAAEVEHVIQTPVVVSVLVCA